MDNIIFGDSYTRDDQIREESNASLDRDSRGRFAKGNKEGRKFEKGYPGKPKGSRNRKTLIAKEFAEDVLYLNPQTGKQMTYHELCIYIKKKADSSPRILNLLLDHVLGKPEEVVQNQVMFILPPMDDDSEKALEAPAVDGFTLPPKPEAIEGEVVKEDEVHLVDSFEEEEKQGQEPF